MRELITGDDIYAQMLMLRMSDARTFVLLEGEDDQRALDVHIDDESAASINCFGKPNVMRAVGIADERQTRRVLAIVDRDWDDRLGGQSSSPNIVYTDWYDLDATIASIEGVVDRIVYANGRKEDIKADIEESQHGSARDMIVAAASMVGLLRFLSVSGGWNLNMREFPVVDVLDPDNSKMGIDPDRLVALAMRRSKMATSLESDVLAAFKRAESQVSDRYYYCCGHDIRSVMSALTNSRWGGKRFGRTQVGSAIRVALTCIVLASTRLYALVSEWAQLNRTKVWSCNLS